MLKYKVKYAKASQPGKVFFGLWDTSIDWIKWKDEQEKDGTEEIQFLMSYLPNTEAKSNPELKVKNIHPMGSYMTTEDWGDEEDED